MVLCLVGVRPATAHAGLAPLLGQSAAGLSRGARGLEAALESCGTPLTSNMKALEAIIRSASRTEAAPEAFTVAAPDPTVPIVITVEHARNAIPDGVFISERDVPWLPQHWSWDPGAELLSRVLLRELGGSAVFCGYSRLLCDPNRSIGHRTQMPTELEGHTLLLNRNLTPEAFRARLNRLYVPFHRAVDEHIAERAATPNQKPSFLLSVHTFTRDYVGETRTLQVGVLHDDAHTAAAQAWVDALREVGFTQVARQQPYTGVIPDNTFSPTFHGRKNGLPWLELEVRNDLVDTPEKAEAVGARIAASLRLFWPEGLAR